MTLALRGADEAARPVVHWLAVLPAWRRRGIGRLLMSVLEARAWELGYREVWLETHAAWEEAVRFYRALGYRDRWGLVAFAGPALAALLARRVWRGGSPRERGR